MNDWDVVVVGAGAAGMMCAIEAGKRGRRVLVLDHAAAPGEKIRISGGGRCNFTNLRTTPTAFISNNPRFCISALSRYSPQDFVKLIERHGVAFHEKAQGQLFCDGSARQVVDLLLREMAQAGVELRLGTTLGEVSALADGGYRIGAGERALTCASLVVASGGKSIPKMGATGLGYAIAERFGLRLTPTKPGLVPLTLEPGMLARYAPLAGVSVEAVVAAGKARFGDALLFTHRGLSGPAVLQASSYWREGEPIEIDLAPGTAVFDLLRTARGTQGRQAPATALTRFLPARLAQQIVGAHAPEAQHLGDLPDTVLREIAAAVNAWRFKPVGTEGYRTAEVTVGGVDTRDLDSRTLAARGAPGLYFVGEVVDVTGWLGGYNFQWAWASGWSAGQVA